VFQTRLSEFVEWLSRFPAPVAIKEAARLRKLNVGATAIAAGDAETRNLEAFASWFRPWLAALQQEYAETVKTKR
jgi:hypothetical protein